MNFGEVVLFVGYAASALVFATFFMRSPLRLRQLAIASNVAFIAYGIIGTVVPVLLLHSLLLPLNIWRLWEVAQIRSQLEAALNGEVRAEWFEMCSRQALRAGDVLFRSGDAGSAIYFITDGTLHLSEANLDLGPGTLIGEISMFSAQGTRTDSAIAATSVNLLSLSKEQLLALYRRHHDFGLYLFRLATSRLLANLERASPSLAAKSIPAASAKELPSSG